MEELMSLDYLHADLQNGVHSEIQGPYNIQWTVTDNSPVNNTKTIDVTVTWRVQGGASKLSTLQFVLADIV
jgi:hypothetical protein